ncbi:MAG: DUF4249 domain-containing protein [Bacteroidia bacterium]
MNKYYLMLFAILFFYGCEQEIELDLPEAEEQLVVEGHIENDRPPYLILTRSSEIFEPISLSDVEEFFVHGAKITVNDGSRTVELQEITIDSAGLQVSVYTTFDMTGESGRTYTLTIEAEGKTLTATTTIPHLLPLDSVWYEPHPEPEADTLVRLMAQYSDPPETNDQVRYFTSRNGRNFWPAFNSVYEDVLINGMTVPVPIDRGLDRTNSVNWVVYPYFSRGDSIVLKWASIDRPHFDFWQGLEFQVSNSGNPFGNITRINGNIVGGLGIWGGYGALYYTVVVPE